jgi:hypothetical protein
MYKTLLIIGISIVFTLNSCERTDNDGSTTTHFKFKNTTSQNVELIVKDRMTSIINVYLLEPNQEKLFSKVCSEGAGNGICGWFTAENELTFKFITDDKCLVNFSKVSNLTLYDNFSTDMYNHSENTLLYLIDTEEVTAATTCN